MALGNLAQRFLVAVVAVPILLVILYLPRPEPTWALIFVASLLAMHEFFVMTLPKEDRRAALVMGAIACLVFYWVDPFTALYYRPSERIQQIAVLTEKPLLLFVIVILPGLYYLFRFRDIPSVAGRITATITGIVYAGLLATFLSLFKRMFPVAEGGHFVVLVLLIAWLADTGGYFAGRFLGKAKLYEAVSPKKTWAGAFGGIAGSIAGVVAMKLLFLPWLNWVDVFAIAIPGGILGQLGDLAESLIKRSVGVKDSGALLPGHGGILDRIDAVLFIAPYVYGYVMIKIAIDGMPLFH
ncbi:MAG: phosphatidate cytidylyltransferase [Deltaproteobacteria bacterium]|nr:phosphatidate cytidylyltransferase [Deltaproteobacteria bacterium]MDQ3300883.1 phosphatidate cytidylyltransferase [Myxococcota bacterium]